MKNKQNKTKTEISSGKKSKNNIKETKKTTKNNKEEEREREKKYNKKNKIIYYLHKDSKRLDTLMNFITESDSNENLNINNKEIRRESVKENNVNNNITNENENIISNRNNNYDDNISNIMLNDEVNLLNEKIKYLEEKNMRLDSLNQMYYDIIKSTNLDYLRNQSNTNIKFQSLDFAPNYRPYNINPNYNGANFAIDNYIDGERNKNTNDFNNSMIDINKKITNYLIDNCIKEKEKNNVIEDVRNEIGYKLDKITKIQKKQKHDIDFIIKYGLNKNRSLEPIIGMILDHPKPLPKLLRDDDSEDIYKKQKMIKDMKTIPFKNFSVYGRYSNKKNVEKNSDGGVLRRSGSSLFDQKYKMDNNKDPHFYNHNIYPNYSNRPIFEKVVSDVEKDVFISNNVDNNGKNKSVDIENEDEYEKERFRVYKGKFFLPADFRFGGKNNKNRNSKNEIKRVKSKKFLV